MGEMMWKPLPCEDARVFIRASRLRDVDAYLRWNVDLDPQDARAFFQLCGTYNNHTGADLVKLIDEVAALVPPMDFGNGPPSEAFPEGIPNPNNGKTHHKFRVGNEGSRVCYLVLNKAYMPAGFDYRALAARLEALAGVVKADEAGLVEDTEPVRPYSAGSFVFRFWWD